MAEPLKIIPLGGLGEIGKNCLLIEYEGCSLVIDAGIIFPEESAYGVDLISPDFTPILQRKGGILGLILTHGHEDHIGAVPLLLKDLKVPIYGTKLTLGLTRYKLEEAGITGYKFFPISPGETLHTGPFSIEFIHVCHSIPDGVGLAIKTPVGTLIHTGDFKVDQTPVDSDPTQLELFARYRSEEPVLLMSDSTHVDKPGYSLSEREVGERLEHIFFKAPGRIFITTFASHIHRIQQILQLSQRFERGVVLAGKRLEENVAIASKLGYLHIPDGLLTTLGEMRELPDHRVTVITTGSQGEPMSVLHRVAMGEHKQLRIRKGDTVIISSRPIPGNERAMANILNQLFRTGATVLYQEIVEVHASGHAHREELKLMINLVRPKFFMPIHGEFLHLIFHSQLAENLGIPRERIILAEDGDVIEFTSDGYYIGERIELEDVMVSGKGIGDVGPQVLKERAKMSHFGTVVVVITLEKGVGRLRSRPKVIARGLSMEEVMEETLTTMVEALLEEEPQLLQNEEELKERIQRSLKRYISKNLERRPLIIPVVVNA